MTLNEGQILKVKVINPVQTNIDVWEKCYLAYITVVEA